MKTLFIPLIAGLLLSCAQSPVMAQEAKEKLETKEKEREERNAEKNKEREEKQRIRYKEKYPEESREHVSKEFTQKTGLVTIYNIDGFIKVEGYAGDKVMIEIDKTISAKDKEKLDLGKSEVKLGFEQIGDSIVAYMLEPYDTRPHEWKDRGNWNNSRDIPYNCTLQYTVKVPYGTNLRLSTVNNGDVDVKNVTGTLRLNNVNGGIAIANAKGTTWAHTINGDLTVNYTSNPPEASTFYTLNGKLTAIFQPNLSADLQFKTMNGGFYTDFENAELLPAKVTVSKESKGEGTMYKLNKDTQLRIGSGGKQFKFETLNGNIYIKKQS